MSTPASSECEASEGDAPDVCSLPRDSLRDRVAMIRREILPHVTRRETRPGRVSLEFERTDAMERTLEELVAFERACCSGLQWKLDRPDGRVLRLDVRGLAPDSELLRAVTGEAGTAGTTGAGRAGGARARGHLARLAQATGLGAGVAFFVCCVVPIGLAAVAGAAVAAPLAGLDQPLVIAGASLATALAAWTWLGRRSASGPRA